MKDLPVTLNLNLMHSGFWTIDSEVQAYLTSVHGPNWATYQSAQGLDPLAGGYVGWGELANARYFLPMFKFSKFFNNSGVAAEKYLIQMYSELEIGITLKRN